MSEIRYECEMVADEGVGDHARLHFVPILRAVLLDQPSMRRGGRPNQRGPGDQAPEAASVVDSPLGGLSLLNSQANIEPITRTANR